MLTQHQKHAEEVIKHLEKFTQGDPGMAMAGGPEEARFTPPSAEQEREILADLEKANRLFEITVELPDKEDIRSLYVLRRKYGFIPTE